jgi:Cys-tRNA(Pro)/Cys-tRNA(Cys) deacylase
MAGGEITLGAGEHGAAVGVDADAALRALDATIADVSEPEE